ncbi:hypothetical protein BDQ12DRAFT_316723 [Crucibulum laeve]|uniref:F-box domain-containing protein n=1 Tax=Crucibulum laeve TaxID=68775 RepID=A0A5C3M303_9AGAR|nr:hypothetical protein BDQ12DRAFT_316723 [Crucibulum laeve]
MPVLIPQDIRDLIMEEIIQIMDEPTIRNCALASRSFTNRCQKHLFKSVTLDIGNKDRYVGFQRILSSDPRIALYIRELSLCDEYYAIAEHGKPYHVLAGITASEYTNYAVKSTLPTMLKLLTRLESFNLELGYHFKSGIGWNSLPKDVTNAFIELAAWKTIKAFSLHSVLGFPSSCLTDLVYKIEQLTLRDVILEDQSSQSFSSFWNLHTSSSKIKSLSLSGDYSTCADVIYQVILRSPFSNLNSISISPPQSDNQLTIDAWEIVRASASTITHFAWMPIRYTLTELHTGPINLRILRNLRSLKFLIGLESGNPFGGVFQLLRQLSEHHPTVEKIIFKCESLVGDLIKYDEDWRYMDELLMKPGYRRLRQVLIVLKEPQSSDCQSRTSINSIFPVCRAKGIEFHCVSVDLM